MKQTEAPRKTIQNTLGEEALTTEGAELAYEPTLFMPGTKVVKIGGQSILDRGRKAVFPILNQLVEAKEKHDILLGCGGGTRARHIYAIAADLELPTGVLAALGGYVPRQNARMIQMLLAKHGGIFILDDDFEKLPLYFRVGCIPIMTGMPPFGYWEKPSKGTRIPRHRTDTGVFLSAEVLGVKRAIYIKDEDGLYDGDPKKNPKAKLIERITASELLQRDLPDLIVERVVIEYLTRTRHCKEIQIVNGLVDGMVRRALEGEDVGTIITQS